MYSFDVGLRNVLNIWSHEQFSWLKDEKRNGLFNGYWTWKSVCPNSLEKRSLCLNILHWESLLAVNSLLLLSGKPTSAELFVVYNHIHRVYIIWSGWWNWLKACRWTLVLSCARQTKQQDLMMWVCSHLPSLVCSFPCGFMVIWTNLCWDWYSRYQ